MEVAIKFYGYQIISAILDCCQSGPISSTLCKKMFIDLDLVKFAFSFIAFV